MPIITKEEENNINKRKRDFTREIIPEEKHGVYEYNRPYYKYMGEGGRIYDSLYKYVIVIAVVYIFIDVILSHEMGGLH